MNKKEELIISCLLPVTKFDEHCKIAVKSIIEQTYTNFEIILLCNNISDIDYSNIKQYYDSYENIRIIKLNLGGLSFALNYGINKANGKYIARMDSDDIAFPHRFEKQLNFLEENLDYSVVGSKVCLIDIDDNIIGKFPYIKNNAQIKKKLPYRNLLVHPALMFRKSVLLEIGGYKYGFMSEDHELFIRLSNNNIKFHNIDETLLYYRRHENQITSSDNKYKHFTEISPFLFMYFLKSFNLKFLLGIIWVLPITRFFKDILKKLRS